MYKLIEKRYELNNETMLWEEKRTEELEVNQKWINNIVESIGFFKNLGGEETKTTYRQKMDGVIRSTTHLVSMSPDRQSKTHRIWYAI